MICRFERNIVIEAIRFLGTKESFDEIRAWVGSNFYYDYQTVPRVFLRYEEEYEGIRAENIGVKVDDWIVLENNQFAVYSDADMSYFKKLMHDKGSTFEKLE